MVFKYGADMKLFRQRKTIDSCNSNTISISTGWWEAYIYTPRSTRNPKARLVLWWELSKRKE